MSDVKKDKKRWFGTVTRGQVESIVEATIATATIVKDVVPFEPAKGALGALCGLLQLLQMYLANGDDLTEIAKRCQRVAVVIKRAAESDKLRTDEHLFNAIKELQRFVEEVCEDIRRRLDRNAFIKAMSVYSDAKKIQTLKETLRDFLQDFQVHLELVQRMDVVEILEWTKAQPVQSAGAEFIGNPTSFTPSKPSIFFGREDLVTEVVDAVTHGQHIVLVGAGGMGKSSIAKAALHENDIISGFETRLFITYDGVAPSAMTYQLFLSRIARALKVQNANSAAILQHLETLHALLVIDNAETFLEAKDTDKGRITEMLDALGALENTRLIMTTRNHSSVSPNLRCTRKTIVGISMDAACDAFSAVYTLAPVDEATKAIFTALDYHPLSINILANAAAMNEWNMGEIQKIWSERQIGVLENGNDKYQSLHMTVEISVASFKDKTLVLQILRAIAFLPQGIMRDDFGPIFPSVSATAISQQIEAIRRSSLIYRNGNRLTMLAPIRMHIADKYSQDLTYNDSVIASIRAWYYRPLVTEGAYAFVEKEHANIERLVRFDMTSSLYISDIATHRDILDKASGLLLCTTTQPTSLWPLFVLEAENSSLPGSLLERIATCLVYLCTIDYSQVNYEGALSKLDFTEMYCRQHRKSCEISLMACLRVRGTILHDNGKLIPATKMFQEALSISENFGIKMFSAMAKQNLVSLLLPQGKFAEAESLLVSIQEIMREDPLDISPADVLSLQVKVALARKDYTKARLLLNRWQELDQTGASGTKTPRLEILMMKASCEGWAGDYPAALKLMETATKFAVQRPMYALATEARAAYEARLGRCDDARKSLVDAAALWPGAELGVGYVLVAACVESLAGERKRAITSLRRLLYAHVPPSKLGALTHRTLGEILLLEGRVSKAKTHFAEVKTICSDIGVPTKYLYTDVFHFHSLPDEYDGWQRFLDGTL